MLALILANRVKWQFFCIFAKKSVIFWKISTPILSILSYEWKLSCSEKYNYMGFWKSKLGIKWSKTHPAVGLHVFLLGAKFALKPELLRHEKKNFQGAIFNFNQNPYMQMSVPLIPSFVCRGFAKKSKLRAGSFVYQETRKSFPKHFAKYQMAYT